MKTKRDTRIWQDLERRFHALQNECGDRLTASWISSGWAKSGECWMLSGASIKERSTFKRLAQRAAVELGCDKPDDTVWLEVLRRESPNMKIDHARRGDDNTLISEEGCRIDGLCSASAEYCFHCGTLASTQDGGPALTTSMASEDSRRKQRPGPKTDLERARRIADIVARVGGGDWQKNIDDIASELDEAEIPCPPMWRRDQYSRWIDCTERGRVVKAIKYQLKVAAQKKIETLS